MLNQPLNPGDGAIFLIDARTLRRIVMFQFLQSIADQPVIAGVDLEDIRRQTAASGASEPEPATTPSVIIVGLGGDSIIEEGQSKTQVSSIIAAFPDCPVALFSDIDARREVLAALKLGVRGFIPTSSPEHLVWPTVQLVRAGGEYAPVRAMLVDGLNGGAGDAPASKSFWAKSPKSHWEAEETAEALALLKSYDADGEGGYVCEEGDVHFSPRELEVLNCVSLGMQNKHIAHSLHMSESTTKVHVRNIMKKLAVTNRTQAAFRARALSLPAVSQNGSHVAAT